MLFEDTGSDFLSESRKYQVDSATSSVLVELINDQEDYALKRDTKKKTILETMIFFTGPAIASGALKNRQKEEMPHANRSRQA